MSHVLAPRRSIRVCKLSVVFAGGLSARDCTVQSGSGREIISHRQASAPAGLTEPEVHGLLRVAGESKRGHAKRNYGLLQLLLQTGLRVSEVTSLKIADVRIRDH